MVVKVVISRNSLETDRNEFTLAFANKNNLFLESYGCSKIPAVLVVL